MLYIYGDHHGQLFSSINVNKLISVCYENLSIHDIVSYNRLPHIHKWNMKKDDILICSLGEQDCRHHIQKKCPNQEDLDNYITSLSNAYISTLANNFSYCKTIIVLGIIPPTRKSDLLQDTFGYCQFDFQTDDEERIKNTNKLNDSIKQACATYTNIEYVYPYQCCQQPDGSIKYSLTNKRGRIAINVSQPVINIVSQCVQKVYS